MEKALKVFNWIEDCIKSYRKITLDDSDRQIIKEAKAETEEAMKQRTCEWCKYFRKSDKACFMSSQNTYIRPASIDFSGCGKHEPKDNA